MFFGVPCIASNIWAMSEMIVDGETGFLIPPEDVSALKQRLEQILFNSNLRASFGKAAQLRAARMFSWNAVGASLHNTLEHLARRSS
jgi:glycosyltransferase involved in cell wall biosynthesis